MRACATNARARCGHATIPAQERPPYPPSPHAREPRGKTAFPASGSRVALRWRSPRAGARCHTATLAALALAPLADLAIAVGARRVRAAAAAYE